MCFSAATTTVRPWWQAASTVVPATNEINNCMRASCRTRCRGKIEGHMVGNHAESVVNTPTKTMYTFASLTLLPYP